VVVKESYPSVNVIIDTILAYTPLAIGYLTQLAVNGHVKIYPLDINWQMNYLIPQYYHRNLSNR
jgi:hypothetical protein